GAGDDGAAPAARRPDDPARGAAAGGSFRRSVERLPFARAPLDLRGRDPHTARVPRPRARRPHQRRRYRAAWIEARSCPVCAAAASPLKTAMCMRMNAGTKNAGISTHGNVGIAAEPAVSKLKRSSEPGAEPTPSVTAVNRSASPNAFQTPAIHPQPATRRWIAHATGSAVAPTRMSPQPAECANVHGS